VSHWGNTGGQQFFIDHGTQTTNLASINRGVLAKLPVPIAPVDEQAEIIREVEERLKAAEALATTLETQIARANETRQSLLRDAFAGRLVAQNSADEPASVLLARIRADRHIESLQKKGTPMSSHKSAIERRPLMDVLRENKKPMTPEDLFHAAGHTQDSVDQFFAELRELTAAPVKIAEQRKTGKTFLRLLP
jgi:type I restriction enzyme S subunit